MRWISIDQNVQVQGSILYTCRSSIARTTAYSTFSEAELQERILLYILNTNFVVEGLCQAQYVRTHNNDWQPRQSVLHV